MHRRIIWITIFVLMVMGNWYDQLNLGSFFLLVFIGGGLSRLFDPHIPKSSVLPPEPAQHEEASIPDDIIRVRRRMIEQIRNSLMRHHNSRATDTEYQSSAAARETTAILQALNSALTETRPAVHIQRPANAS